MNVKDRRLKPIKTAVYDLSGAPITYYLVAKIEFGVGPPEASIFA
jgi:hypothetical protein